MRHSMLLTLPDRPGRTIRLIAFRADSPRFSERDRAVLMLLRPHLYAGYLQWKRRRTGRPELTDRQWQLLQLVALGHTNAQITRRLGVAEGTVRKHMRTSTAGSA
jgi:DNA-binding NarL/FixJ family response regulator